MLSVVVPKYLSVGWVRLVEQVDTCGRLEYLAEYVRRGKGDGDAEVVAVEDVEVVEFVWYCSRSVGGTGNCVVASW